MSPRLYDAEAVRAALPFERLIPALRSAFSEGATVPLRTWHDMGRRTLLLLMPAWRPGGVFGVKILSMFPDNGTRGLPAVSSTYLLCDGETGAHLAVIDGAELTARRTAAASALAGDFLARADATRLLIVGSGEIAGRTAQAWRAVRPIAQVTVWNIRAAGAHRLAAALRGDGFDARATEDLQAAVAAADIVSCATLAQAPLVRGAWLRPGTHLDLVGGFLPTMRETDDDAVRRAQVWVDTGAALLEAGDLTQPLASGALQRADIAGDLASLCRGEAPGRTGADQITLFKSVGTALEDLAAASLVCPRRLAIETG